MTLLPPDTQAPDFSAEASDGRSYRLHQLLQQSRVLLVFYPGNNTPG
jgi:peroxiredoxin